MDKSLPARILRTGAWLAVFLVAAAAAKGRSDIAWGLAIGSCLSLFSLGSIAWAAPRAIRPGERGGPWLLAFVFVLKLPVYGIALYYAVGSKWVSVGAVFAGVALVPTVILLKAVGHMLMAPQPSEKESAACRKDNKANP